MDLAVDGEMVDSIRAPGGLVVVVNPADESDVSITDEGEKAHEFSFPGGLVDVEIRLPQNGSCALLAIEVDDGPSSKRPRTMTGRSGCTTCPFLETQPGPSRLGAGSVFTSDGDPGDLPDDLHPNGDGYARIGQRCHALAG